MKKIILAMALILALSIPAWGSNTVTTANDADGKLVAICITPDGSTAWDSSSTYASGLSVAYILFCPSAAADRLVFRLNSDTGAEILRTTVDTTASQVLYVPNRRLKLYLKQTTDCNFGTPANVRIIIVLK